MRLAVGEWPEALVVFLAGCVPKSELYRFAVYTAVGYVILKDGRDVALHEVSIARCRD